MYLSGAWSNRPATLVQGGRQDVADVEVREQHGRLGVCLPHPDPGLAVVDIGLPVQVPCRVVGWVQEPAEERVVGFDALDDRGVCQVVEQGPGKVRSTHYTRRLTPRRSSSAGVPGT